jgi:hypothetical protein
MNPPPLVSCLCVTHGRYRHLQMAVACFLEQDYEAKELLILNHHRVPLVIDQPDVHVFNFPNEDTFGTNLNDLLASARGEYIRTWDDDDLYLPWAISQGIAYIGNRFAWKPLRSWWYDGQKNTLTLESNNFEPSVTWRRDFVAPIGYDRGHHECSLLHEAATQVGGIPSVDMGYMASFLSSWGTGVFHLSGSLGNGQTPEQRAENWRLANQDHGRGKPLEPVRASAWWRLLWNHIPDDVRPLWKDKINAKHL